VKTVITDSPKEAAEFIRRGSIVAFPTETVYGLGADVFGESAIQNIFKAKSRPADNPLIVHVSSADQISSVASEVTESAEILIDAFFPGPLTVVLTKRSEIPAIATAGLNTVGIRMPRNKTASAFLAACATPVVAPSANISGRPSPTTWNAVYEDLDGRIDCILKGEATEIGLESTVVDCTGAAPLLLRPGAISLVELRSVVADIIVSGGGDEERRSPGMRHQHYSPRASVKLVSPADAIDDPGTTAFIGLHDRSESFAFKTICSSTDEYAHKMFEFFRECDRRGIEIIYCESVPETGIGTALMDRLRRAATRP
jgi:L-threonylcarbamoyladenylate synthase